VKFSESPPAQCGTLAANAKDLGRQKAMKKRQMALVVDDEAFFANLVSRILMQLDYNSVICSSFELALDLIERTKIDLVVTDIFMPGIGGIEGIRLLKEKYPDTIVIAMSGGWSGMTAEDTVKAANKIGADGGLEKPFSADDLSQILELLA
jgi:DNA-binding NtrC family response regulator